MPRQPIPKKIRDALLVEFGHRCAKCGSDKPQVHHIDEDATNNASGNLLPLCPNCHIRDQHSPTTRIEPEKLRLFRKYKDPAIFKPQFHPIFIRLSFLDSVVSGDEPIGYLAAASDELIRFIQEFAMGSYYAQRLAELLEFPEIDRLNILNSDPRPQLDAERARRYLAYRDQLLRNRDSAKRLIIEQLRYQNWPSDT